MIDDDDFDYKQNSISISDSGLDHDSITTIYFDLLPLLDANLDVFEVEPLPKNSVLRGMNNVLLSPHNSNASPKVFNEVDKKSIKNLFSGLKI